MRREGKEDTLTGGSEKKKKQEENGKKTEPEKENGR